MVRNSLLSRLQYMTRSKWLDAVAILTSISVISHADALGAVHGGYVAEHLLFWSARYARPSGMLG